MVIDKQEQYYIDYVQSESYSQVADKHGVNRSTVWEAVQRVKDEIEQVEELKKRVEVIESTSQMIDHEN